MIGVCHNALIEAVSLAMDKKSYRTGQPICFGITLIHFQLDWTGFSYSGQIDMGLLVRMQKECWIFEHVFRREIFYIVSLIVFLMVYWAWKPNGDSPWVKILKTIKEPLFLLDNYETTGRRIKIKSSPKLCRPGISWNRLWNARYR